ncbi:endo alpha-1,4 polygalactosaminidase [Fervidobacterium thailandense]|uniref:Glycoside-hydrolase family GH114 TIM-barrel domain-containing protein n=1 Tax=Fervidobacterium thailandense TaxID=1008305 RepID=A0A1E3G574_9BACT|nr:endo alpha-1,4 polygalactosaminidase [Fervidobacterium thailandense]ODN31292.1 hypothetical protein A4H02_00495 [Fervidobacterium thailandense]
MVKILDRSVFLLCIVLIFALFSRTSVGLMLLNITVVQQEWLLFLNGPKLEDIARTNVTPVIIDYSRDGSESKEFTREDIEPLKRMSNGKTREVLAYVNVGIAERWRWYWSFLPSTLLYGPLEGWEGEYYIKFWTDEWISTLEKYVEKIVGAGFDGIMFDWVNVYYSKSLQKYSKLSESQLRELMAETLRSIVNKFPNLVYAFVNGEDILNLYPDLRSKVKYVVVEDLFFNNNQLAIETKAFKDRLEKLLRLKEHGISVLSVEYVDNGNPFDEENAKRIKSYIEQAKLYGFKYYVASVDRKLNEINIPRIRAG